jgi:acetyltransferase
MTALMAERSASKVGVVSAHRSTNLDALRAVAALSVLVAHAYLLSGPTGADELKRSLVLSSGVWLFFALSGYLISGPFIDALVTGRSLPQLHDYARRRFARIFPAYLVALAAVIAFGLARGTSIRWWQLPVHGALVHNLVPNEQQAIYRVSWTLTVELLFYLFVPLAALLIRRAYRKPISMTSVVVGTVALWMASVAWTLVSASAGDPTTSAWLRGLFPSMLSMFCPGIIVAAAVVHWRHTEVMPGWLTWICRHRRFVSFSAVVLAAVAALGTAGADSVRIYDLSRQCFALSFGLVVALAITRPQVRGVAGMILGWLGVISYGIYLWHGVLVQVIERHGVTGWVPLPHGGTIALVVHVAYLLGLTLPLAWASWVFIERPAIRWAKQHSAPAALSPSSAHHQAEAGNAAVT